MGESDVLDLVIIGGGIGGVICLKYAKDAGLKVALVERSEGVGGIWRKLPSWQDIQFRKEDWTLGDIPVEGEDQRSICKNIEAWVSHFGLREFITFNTQVRCAEHADGLWCLQTSQKTYHSRYLVDATGGHVRPVIPPVQRRDSKVLEFHSSTLANPEVLTGATVTIVGGGASAYDLLDLCMQKQAAHVVWVHRSLKWMLPTRKQKHFATNMRELGKRQLMGVSIDRMNRVVGSLLTKLYRKAGLAEILPKERFDFRRHQFIPGRRDMIKNFQRIERHPGQIQAVSGNSVQASDSTQFDTDIIIWATGYELDLSHYQIPAIAQLKRLEDLQGRCGGLCKSLDAPQLYFLAPGVLETSGATPFAYAHLCKSIMAELQGFEVFDQPTTKHHVNYLDLVKFLARRDAKNYGFFWYIRYLTMFFRFGNSSRPLPLP